MNDLFAIIGRLPKAFEIEEPTIPSLGLQIEEVPRDQPLVPFETQTEPSSAEREAAAASVRAKLAKDPPDGQ
jgi:hypothetical protein